MWTQLEKLTFTLFSKSPLLLCQPFVVRTGFCDGAEPGTIVEHVAMLFVFWLPTSPAVVLGPLLGAFIQLTRLLGLLLLRLHLLAPVVC